MNWLRRVVVERWKLFRRALQERPLLFFASLLIGMAIGAVLLRVAS